MSRFFRIIPNKRIIGSYQWRNLSRFGVNNFVFSQKSLFASAPHPNNGTNVALNEVFDDGDNEGNRGGGSSWFEYLRTVPGAILGGCTIVGTFIGYGQWKKQAQADRDWDNRIISAFSTPIPAFDDVAYYVSRSGDEYAEIKLLCTPDGSSYSHVITGKKMIGKSTMVKVAINELRGEYENIVYFDFAGGKIDEFNKTLNAFPQSTYGYRYGFYSHLSHPTDLDGPTAFRRTLGDVPSQLAKMSRNDDLYHHHINTLILDSVNELSDEHLNWLLGFIKGCVDNGLLKVIMVVSPGKTVSKIVQNKYTQGRIFMGYHVAQDMGDKEATQYINKWGVVDVDDDKIIDVIKDVTGKRIGYLRQIMTVFDKEFGTKKAKKATKENVVKVLFEKVLKGRINEAIQGFKDIKMTSKEIEKLLFETLPNGTLTEPQYKILSDSNIVALNKKEKQLEWECKPIELCFNTESVKNDIKLQIKYQRNLA